RSCGGCHCGGWGRYGGRGRRRRRGRGGRKCSRRGGVTPRGRGKTRRGCRGGGKGRRGGGGGGERRRWGLGGGCRWWWPARVVRGEGVWGVLGVEFRGFCCLFGSRRRSSAVYNPCLPRFPPKNAARKGCPRRSAKDWSRLRWLPSAPGWLPAPRSHTTALWPRHKSPPNAPRCSLSAN